MKNIERYPNTKDALGAFREWYKDHEHSVITMSGWLEKEYEAPRPPTMAEAAKRHRPDCVWYRIYNDEINELCNENDRLRAALKPVLECGLAGNRRGQGPAHLQRGRGEWREGRRGEMTLTELTQSGILPRASVSFKLCKPLFGRYAQSSSYSWEDLRKFLLEPFRERPFPWADDEVVEILPDSHDSLLIRLAGEIGG